MPRAFILDKVSNYDFTSLIPQWVDSEDNFIYLFNGESGNYRPSVWNKMYQQAIIERLISEKFDPEVDFFVVTGAFIPITIACAVLGITFDAFQMLQFSNAESSYNLVRMEYNGQ